MMRDCLSISPNMKHYFIWLQSGHYYRFSISLAASVREKFFRVLVYFQNIAVIGPRGFIPNHTRMSLRVSQLNRSWLHLLIPTCYIQRKSFIHRSYQASWVHLAVPREIHFNQSNFSPIHCLILALIFEVKRPSNVLLRTHQNVVANIVRP